MAITICEKDRFKSKLIPHSIGGGSDQLDSCCAAFKRIYKICVENDESFKIIANLQLTVKTSIRVDLL